MKDLRHGDQLWEEWSGDGFEDEPDALIYYTIEHVPLTEEVVRRALASTLQRDGVADSLADGFSMIDSAEIILGWAGVLPEELSLVECDDTGETFYGDTVETIYSITFVKIHQ